MTAFDCKECKDTGFITIEKEGTEYARRCKCQSRDLLLSKSERANIPLRFAGADLGGYYPDKSNPYQVKAKKTVENFVRDYPAVDKGLLLQGTIGVGKTRLLCAIATELMEKFERLDVYYIDWNDLVRKMGSGEDHSSRDFNAINTLINKLAEVELLLFDELAASRVSQWVYDNIYFLINKRYNNKKSTICATNFYDNPSDGSESLTQRIGERLRSRLFEMTHVVEVKGIDYRQKYL